MNAVMTEAPVVTNRCKIDEVFAGPFIELIVLAPRNPVVRGLILAQTGKMPEPERQTFEQIKDWVETTCDKKVRPANQTNGTRTPSRDGIVIKVEFGETEHGRAHYSVNRSGTDEFALDEAELLAFVQAAIDDGYGLDEVIEKIAEEIDDNAWNRCDPSLEDYGDYDYDDHDANDSDNSTVEFSKTQIRDRLLAFLQTRHPQLLEELS
jgi:hypothetical protein